MVAAVRRGASLRAAARAAGVSLRTAQRWVARAADRRLERVDWRARSTAPHRTRRTAPALEDLVLDLRRELRETSDLGEWGAAAIQRELGARAVTPLPSVRTIGRILARRGALDARARVRRPAPPPGWYLPDVAAGRAELDSFDAIEGLVLQGGPAVEVLTGVSLHGGLPAAWPAPAVTARGAAARLVEHWRAWGLPAYAQFDNDTRFQGPHQHPDVVSRVMRLCLSLGVVPVFAPVRESGFQAAVEGFNGRWQAKVWARFRHPSLAALQAQSARYLAAARSRGAVRLEGAPARRPFPAAWALDLQAHPRGGLVFLRRTTDRGTVGLLGRTFPVDPHWRLRLVRGEVQLDAGVIRFYALRRRDPAHHPLLGEVAYELPRRRFRE
jgi:leucine-zipper of insertion element IS481